MKYDVVIIGGGITGLTIAHQLLLRRVTRSICIMDMESSLGKHNSGRNSGVIHAGLYYKPGSLKSAVCVNGAKRLLSWCSEHNVNVNKCGKVIVPQKPDLDSQLDVLLSRSNTFNAKAYLINSLDLQTLFPAAYSVTGRALYSPNTAVIDPIKVIKALTKLLTDQGVQFRYQTSPVSLDTSTNSILDSSGSTTYFGHLFNAAGLGALKLAQSIGIGLDYSLLPFKGSYWKLSKNAPFNVPCNLYPVPDLQQPFLGIHLTPNADMNQQPTVGPTATMAFSRYNYKALDNIVVSEAVQNSFHLSQMIFKNSNNMLTALPHLLRQLSKRYISDSIKQLVPAMSPSYLEPCSKVGIRPQLINLADHTFIDDFICINFNSTTHVLNAISPAFTASFELADLILNRSINPASPSGSIS